MSKDRCCRGEHCKCHRKREHHRCEEERCKCHKEKKHHRCEKEFKRDTSAGIFEGCCGNISFIIFLILVLLMFSGGIEI
jgi:hypothetical protein